jgi:hypothetical protein
MVKTEGGPTLLVLRDILDLLPGLRRLNADSVSAGRCDPPMECHCAGKWVLTLVSQPAAVPAEIQRTVRSAYRGTILPGFCVGKECVVALHGRSIIGRMESSSLAGR